MSDVRDKVRGLLGWRSISDYMEVYRQCLKHTTVYDPWEDDSDPWSAGGGYSKLNEYIAGMLSAVAKLTQIATTQVEASKEDGLLSISHFDERARAKLWKDCTEQIEAVDKILYEGIRLEDWLHASIGMVTQDLLSINRNIDSVFYHREILELILSRVKICKLAFERLWTCELESQRCIPQVHYREYELLAALQHFASYLVYSWIQEADDGSYAPTQPVAETVWFKDSVLPDLKRSFSGLDYCAEILREAYDETDVTWASVTGKLEYVESELRMMQLSAELLKKDLAMVLDWFDDRPVDKPVG